MTLNLALRTALVLVILAVFAGAISAQEINDDPEVVSLYARGKRLMREGAWLEASRLFQSLAGRFSNSDNLDLFVFHRAKSDLYFGDYSGAIAGYKYYLSRFPNAAERAHANFFLGNAYYLKGEAGRALSYYLEAYRIADDKRLVSLLESSVRHTIKNAVSVNLGKADFEPLSPERKCSLIKIIVEELIDKEQLDVARRIAGYCENQLDFGNRLEYTPGSSRDDFEVAMMLPFSGELQSFGEEIYNGAVIAAELIRHELGINLHLSAYDTRGEAIEAARIVAELSDSPIDLTIGPLTSEAAAVASAALSCGSMPMIIPAATQAGLTTLSPTSFQLSPNIELEGRVMADYAFSRLGADSAVIITSTRSEHLRMAQAFARRFDDLGGEVIAIQYYRPRDNDFGPHIRDVKGMILGTEPDSTYFISETGDTLKFDGLTVKVDCLFIPGTPKQLKQLLAQLNFYNLTGAYLGTDGWGDRDVYKLGDKVTKGAIFASPFLSTGQGSSYLKFSAAYDTRFGRQPDRLANLGFDATRLAALAISRGGYDRVHFLDRLMETRSHEGAAGVVTFGSRRENVEMPLYRIENERAVPFNPTAASTETSE